MDAVEELLIKQRKQKTYRDKPKRFKHTEACQPAANFYRQHGVYTFAASETPEWENFWDRERDRCLYGYVANAGTDDEIYITGFHYFYLNYMTIYRAVPVEMPDGTMEEKRESDFPRFYDGDWEWFMIVEEAKKNKKNLSCLKARRKGYSYKAAAMLLRNYFLRPGSKGFVIVANKDFLTQDGLFTKAWPAMSFVDEHTAWTQPRLKNSEMEKVAGYQEKIDGVFIDKGTFSTIQGVTIGDDPDKIRGKAGDLVFFEEAGAFKDLLTCWGILQPSMKQGNFFLGSMIAFGTGGEQGEDFEGLEELFYRPEAYHIMEFNNIWDTAADGTTCGYFVPNYVNLDGFMDEWGNTDQAAATQFSMDEREIAKKASSQKVYDQHIAEYPLTPREAVMNFDSNELPIAELVAHKNYVLSRGLDKLGTPGMLFKESQGQVKFKPDYNLKPLLRFPHDRKDGDLSGAVIVYEQPYRGPDGRVPDFLYIICHDPYAHKLDKKQVNKSTSIGSAYVIKRINNFSQPDDIIVASWNARPASQDDYNRQLFLLAEYYNAKIGFENDRGEVIPFARRFHTLHYLQPNFMMPNTKELQSLTNRDYGMHMSTPRKEQGELYIRDWLLRPRGVDPETGLNIYNLHTIKDPALLDELIKFNHDGNFDRVMALMVGMYHLNELTHVSVEDAMYSRAEDDFFKRDLFR